MRRAATIPPVSAQIDWDALDRLEEYANQAREEMGEAKWRELNAEWGE